VLTFTIQLQTFLSYKDVSPRPGLNIYIYIYSAFFCLQAGNNSGYSRVYMIHVEEITNKHA